MEKILSTLYNVLWGAPMLIWMFLAGVWMSICTGCAQLRLFPRALRFVAQRESTGSGTSPFRALCTALAATVGTGNLVGVAGAICLGGPGAVFWMLVFAFLGMAVKYAEATLAVSCRSESSGEAVGGPMYMIRDHLPKSWHPMAYVYAICGILASFGVGNLTQVNAIVSGIQSFRFGGTISPWCIGLILAGLVGFAFWRGADSIGRIAEKLVPYAAGIFILLCIFFLTCKAARIPAALYSIFAGAFHPRAITGGAIGSAARAIQIGCSRGIFTHEAGMGTASIAHASAEVSHPAEQGLMGLLEVFLDTFVICVMTALVILCSGVPISYGVDSGAELTVCAFSAVYGWMGKIIVVAFLACFAYATILGWSLYGLRCAEFVFGRKSGRIFLAVQTVAVAFGAMMETPLVWTLAEIFNGLMAIPNLITLFYLSPKLKSLTNSYIRELHVLNRR